MTPPSEAHARAPAPAHSDVAALPGVETRLLESVRRNGTRVTLQAYERRGGTRDALLFFVHGMCGTADNYIFQLRALPPHVAFFTYDMLGCGASGELAGRNLEALEFSSLKRYFAPRRLVEDLEAAWRAATHGGARPCVVVAHSYSTSLVTQWLAARERREPRFGTRNGVCGVVLLETHATIPPIAAGRAARLGRSLPLALQYAAMQVFSGPLRWWRLLGGGESVSLGSLGPVGARSAEAKRLWLKWERQKSAALYAASVCTCDWARERDFAHAYAQTPLAVCWGGSDELTPVDARFWRVDVAPALRSIKVCEGFGHWPMLDNADFDAWFAATLAAFARGAPPVRALPPEPSTCVGAELGDDAPVCAECGGEAAVACGACAAERGAAAAAQRYCGDECARLAWERGHAAAHARARAASGE